MLPSPATSQQEHCLACGHSRQGVAESARCPECELAPLHTPPLTQAQSSFISTARCIFGFGIFLLAATGPHIATGPGMVRAVFAVVAFGSVWNWPQLWLSHPPALRVKARVRLGITVGIAAGLLLSGSLGQPVAKSLLRLEPSSWLRGVVTACFLFAAAFLGWILGRWRASRLLAANAE